MRTVFGLSAGLEAVMDLLRAHPAARVAIDGRCAAGKSTLAAQLAERTGAALLHMDDFFLRPQQRTPARYAEPGGNVDRERFMQEVLQPLCLGQDVVYRPFDCARQALGPAKTVPHRPLTIVEGTYALHPALRGAYDLRVMLTADPRTQRRRLARRNPALLQTFLDKWIPLEEAYFTGCAVAACCTLVVDTSLPASGPEAQPAHLWEEETP